MWPPLVLRDDKQANKQRERKTESEKVFEWDLSPHFIRSKEPLTQIRPLHPISIRNKEQLDTIWSNVSEPEKSEWTEKK